MTTGTRLSERLGEFGAVPVTLMLDTRAGAAHVATYAAVASILDQRSLQGTMRQRLIAHRARISRRQVQRTLTDLVAWGYLAQRTYKGHRSVYVLCRLRGADELPLLPGNRRTPGAGSRSEPAPSTTQAGAMVAPRVTEPLSDKQGAEEDLNDPPIWPASSFVERFDPHAWDHVSNGNGKAHT